MRFLGFLLLVLGIGSAVVHFMNMEMRLLRWIDNWGENTAWGIRGGCVLLGAILLFAGKSNAKKPK
ncbi:MAG: hypothetical protein ABIP94_23620 [Planctomycetota bacterium]